MTINPQLKEIFQHYNINYDEGILYLLSLYFKLKIPSDKFEQTIKQINFSKIVERDYDTIAVNEWNIIWNTALFIEQNITPDNWSWIQDYRKMFTSINKERGGTLNSCQKRMKKFFSDNPHIRKEDVMEATKLYLKTVKDGQYLISADYFIKKSAGVNETSKLEQFLELYYETKKTHTRDKML